MGLISSEKIQSSFLFQLDQKANRERCKGFIATHAPADDRPTQALLHAEWMVRDVLETLDRHHDDDEIVKLGEQRLTDAVECLEHALAMWEPHTPSYDLFYFKPTRGPDEKRRN